MITNPDAHGFCPGVASQGGHPKALKFLKPYRSYHYAWYILYNHNLWLNSILSLVVHDAEAKTRRTEK